MAAPLQHGVPRSAKFRKNKPGLGDRHGIICIKSLWLGEQAGDLKIALHQCENPGGTSSFNL